MDIRPLYICGYKVDCILLGMIRKWFLCSFEHELAILHLITIRSTLRILLRLLAIAMAFTLESNTYGGGFFEKKKKSAF